MVQMQFEESENLKFDIEILSDEKALLEGDLNHTRDTLREAEARLLSLQQKVAESSISEQNLNSKLI